RRAIRQLHVVLAIAAREQRLAKRENRRMHAQLQNRIDAPIMLALQLLERLEIPRIQYERLLADRVRPDAQRKPDMRVMQMIRRADTQIMNALFERPAAQLLDMPIEALELGKKRRIAPIAIENPDRVMR